MNKKPLPTGVRVLLGFVSVILCIVLFLCSIVTILVADLSLLTSKGGLQKLIQDVLFSTSAPARPGFSPAGVLPGRVPVRLTTPEADMMGGIDFGNIDLSGIVSGEGASGAIADVIFSVLKEQFPETQLTITKEDMTTFVEESTLTEFFSDKVSGFVVDVINGESTTTITKEEIVELLEENKQLIKDTFKTEIPQEVIESVGTFVEESNFSESLQQSVSDIVGVEVTPPAPSTPNEEKPSTPGSNGTPGSNDTPGSNGTTDKPAAQQKPVFRPGDLDVLEDVATGNVSDMGIKEALAMVRIITAPAVLIGCIATCLLLSALLFLTNWGRPNAALRCSGITYFIAGLLFLLPSAAAQFVPSVFVALGIPGIAANAIRQVLVMAGTISLGVTLFGLVLIIGAAVWGSALKKKHIAAAAAAAVVTSDAADLSDALLAAEEAAEEMPDALTADDGSDLVAALLGAEETEEAAAEEAEV